MSRETAEARFAADAADRKWKTHQGICGACAHAASRAFPRTEPCREGSGLRTMARNAAAALKRSRELDKQPTPGQEAMF